MRPVFRRGIGLFCFSPSERLSAATRTASALHPVADSPVLASARFPVTGCTSRHTMRSVPVKQAS